MESKAQIEGVTLSGEGGKSESGKWHIDGCWKGRKPKVVRPEGGCCLGNGRHGCLLKGWSVESG